MVTFNMNTNNELSNGAIFPIGQPLPDMFSKYFVGRAYLNMLTTEGISVGNMTFEPGCRNNWHIHHDGGQILLVTGGNGYYQARGEEVTDELYKKL